MDDITITYLGQKITFSGRLSIALRIKNRYMAYADVAAKLYIDEHYNKYGSFAVFANSYIRDIAEILKPCYQVMAQELLQYGLYDTNEEQILREYGDFLFSELYELYNKITEICNTADNIAEVQRQLRELRKASRTQMVGGGYGIAGMVAGAAAAGAYNTMSGLLHSGANAIGNSRTKIKCQNELQKLYHSQVLQDRVASCVWSSVDRIGFVIAYILGFANTYPTDEQKSRARVLRSNLLKIPEESRPEIIAEILSVLPCDMDTYKLLLPLYGDFGGMLRIIVEKMAPLNLAEFDDIRETIFKKKAQIISSDYRKAVTSKLANNTLDADIDVLQNEAGKRFVWNGATLGYSLNDSIVSQEIHLVQDYTRKLKIVNGVFYDTFSLAQKAIANRKTCEDLWPPCEEELNYSRLSNALQTVRNLNEEEPKGAVSDYIEIFFNQLKKADKHRKEQFREKIESIFVEQEKIISQLGAADLEGGKLKEQQETLKKQIKDCSKSFGLESNSFDENQALQMVDIRVTNQGEKRSRQIRTVNGILYDTFELAEKARVNHSDGEKLVQACDSTDNIDICWVLQRLQQLNHRDPAGSVSDCVDKMLANHFGRKDTNDYTLNGVIFSSILERQDTECEFRLLISKCMPGNLTEQGLTALKAELSNIPNMSQLYKLVNAHIEDAEKVLLEQQTREAAKAQEQRVKEAAKIEMQQQQQSTLKSSRIRTGVALCFGILFLNTILNAPLIALNGTLCTFTDIINAAIHGGGMSAIALALIYVVFGFYIIKEILKAVAVLFTQRGSRRNLFGYSAWLCLLVIAFSMIGGDRFDCESRVFIWLIASLVGYACIDSSH